MHLLARIVGLSTASIPVTGPVGVLATGVLIDAIGLRQTLLVSTALAAVIAVATWASSGPRLFDPTTDLVAEQAQPAVPAAC